MVRRDDAKTQALTASRTLNPRPERVTDPAFGPGGFFDPADLVQVKYEMVRRAEVTDVPTGQAAAAFGFSRQSLYSARTALRERGLAGLVPAKPGPKGGHKLTGQVVDLLEELLAADPGLRPAELAAAVWQRFGISLHPRSVERALQRRRTSWREDEQAPGRRRKASDQPGSGNAVIAGDDRAAFTWRYEVLRSAAAAESGGWRHGLGVLVTRGVAAWMAAWASLPAASYRILEEARDRVCQCRGVAERDEQPGAPVLDDLGEPLHARRHQRALREHRLHRGVAERLYPRRHQHDGGEDGVVGWTYPAKCSAPR